MKKLISLFVLGLFSLSSYSQDNSTIESPKNVIHGSIGTFLLVNSAQLTYDRFLKQSDTGFFKSYYLTVKGGGNVSLDFSGNDSGSGYVTSLGVTALTGKGKNHFEAGLGLGYFIDTRNIVSESNSDGTADESTFFPNISIGYRKQSTKGFMFRTGIGIVEWAYVGFGFSF